MLGMLTENGPYNVKYDKHGKPRVELEFNKYSWNNKTNLLYLDQPIGTGLSFASSLSSYRYNGEELARDFYAFLVGFLD